MLILALQSSLHLATIRYPLNLLSLPLPYWHSKVPAARMTPWGVRLDTPPPTATRAPGMCNGHAMIESILQHAACEVGFLQTV